MDDRLDPILSEQKSVLTKGFEYSFVGISKSSIDVVDTCVSLIWVMGNKGKVIKPRDIIENIQHTFMSEEIKSQDRFWKEHSAGSLRELVDNHFETDCTRFFKTTPIRSTSEEDREIWEKNRNFKDFLNDLAHFQVGALDKAKIVVNDDSVSEIDEKVFDKICTNFILHLEKLFKFKNR